MSIQTKEKEIIQAIENGKNVFIHGEGGTGKTFLLKYLFHFFSQKNKKCELTAMTGCASAILEGSTLHKFSGIGLGDSDEKTLLKKILTNPKAKYKWIHTDILFIDEVSMLGAELFNKLNYISQNVRGNKKGFGGLQLVLCGDLFQLPPVKDKFIFETDVFNTLNIQTIELLEFKRFTDKDFIETLSRIRIGEHTKEDMKKLKLRYDSYKKLDLETIEIKPTIVYSKKIDVEYENKLELDKLKTDEYIFYTTDSFIGDNEKQIEYLVKELENLIPSKIRLKIGAQVMLKYNMDTEIGLVNGSRGVVTDIIRNSDVILVKFANGVEVPISRHTWELKDRKLKIKVSRTQIPLILAWAITIHKSQGLTLDFMVCSLNEIFEYGQAYVALSRARNFDGLYISSDLTEKEFKMCIRANPKVLEFLKK